MGYGSGTVELLYRCYNGEMVDLLHEHGRFSDIDSGKETDDSDQEENAFEGNDIGIKKLKLRKKTPPFSAPVDRSKSCLVLIG
jgi:hypothetical protein